MSTTDRRVGHLGLTYYEAPPALHDRIRLALRPRRSARDSWWWRWSWTALAPTATGAFAVLSAINVALIAAIPSKEDRVTDEVVTSHVRALMTSRPIDVVSSDQHTVKPWYAGKLDFSPPVTDFAAQGFALAGGRVDYVNGRAVAALVYRDREHLIDLFVWPASQGEEAVTAIERRGFNVVHWSSGGMAYWAASDAEAASLERLRQLVAANAM